MLSLRIDDLSQLFFAVFGEFPSIKSVKIDDFDYFSLVENLFFALPDN